MDVIAITPDDPRSAPALADALHALAEAGVQRLLIRELSRGANELEWLLAETRNLPCVLHARCQRAAHLAQAMSLPLHLPAGHPPVVGAIGHSTHNAEELERARGAEYALLSPVFAPTSKPDDRRVPLGVRGFTTLAARSRLPVYALGGVTPARIPELRAAGIRRVAVLGALFRHGGLDLDAAAALLTA